MAPPRGSARGRKAVASKQLPKPVVPALPLAQVKRTVTKTPGKHQSVTTSASGEVQPPSSQAPPDQLDMIDTARKASSGETAVASNAATTQDDSQNPPPSGGSANESEKPRARRLSDSDTDERKLSIESNVKSPSIVSVKKRSASTNLEQPSAADSSTTPSRPKPQSEAFVSSSATSFKVDKYNASKTAKARPPPQPVSPSRYQIPTPFQPPHGPYGLMSNSDVTRGAQPPVPNGVAHMHHSHPSNGSIHFGTFQDSQNTSPAPPHSGGIVPPPPMPTADGHPAYISPAGNGLPPMMPYGADMMQPSNFDTYGRPAMGFGPIESFPMYGNNFGPSTPHSFHNSRSSGQPEDNAMYHPYPANGHRNEGGTGPGDLDGQARSRHGGMLGPAEYAGMVHGHGLLHHLIPHEDNGDRLVDYMKQLFGDTELADCTLELRYVGDRAAPPVRVPGHRLIFARSRVLQNLMRQPSFQLTSARTLQTVQLESGSKWLRSDSFYMSVQRLYGLPLLSLPPRSRPQSPSLTDAGTTNDQLDFALSYAAAGQLLEWAPVVRRGCEVATQLLSWHCMEKIIEFALEGYVDNGGPDSFKYGDGSKILLDALVAFIVHNIPATFKLDVSSVDPKQYARLPECPPMSKAREKSAPVVARGSSVQFGKGRRSQQITSIQFGDLCLGDEASGPDLTTPKAAQQTHAVSNTVLSRVLLNLPFTQLKLILESSSSGNVDGWANAESRYRIVRSAVREREERRLCALEAVLRGQVPESERLRVSLCSPNPQDMGHWSVLGWREEVLPCGSTDGPGLRRKWVPCLDAQDNPATAAYP